MSSNSFYKLIADIRTEKGYNQVSSFDFSFENISFKYDSDTKIFEDASFRLEKGKSTALIGVNGSGKTTILKILSGFEESSENMHVNGHVIGFSSAEGLDVNPYLTCKKFISICLEDLVEKYLLSVLKVLHLESVYKSKIITLSSGQRKKLSIFKAFVTGKDIVFLDEPSAHLDIETRDQIIEIILGLKKSIPIILITHSKEILTSCVDNIYKVRGFTSENGNGKIELINNLN
ncbi:MAG: ATP-binding cassette domain-containing protein [Prolixibacteraceae bacterium]|nr:ATP-binding cassette domain-containing protein [Prolixibacteraceae bacterium]